MTYSLKGSLKCIHLVVNLLDPNIENLPRLANLKGNNALWILTDHFCIKFLVNSDFLVLCKRCSGQHSTSNGLLNNVVKRHVEESSDLSTLEECTPLL